MENIRVALADDHAIVRAGIRKIIDQIPHLEAIDELGNGPEVFDCLKNKAIDLLLIDVTMPEFDPIIAIKKIREMYPLLKILVISAYDDEIYVKGLINAGVNGYHMKDQSLKDLKLAILQVLKGKKWISSSLINKLASTNNSHANVPALTNRQRDLLYALQKGHDNKTIANKMGISIKTVENNLTHLYRKLRVQSRLEAVNYSRQHPNIFGTPAKEAQAINIPVIGLKNSSLNILVVDDNLRYRKQLIRMLGEGNQDATIYQADTISHTLDLLKSIKFNLVIIDVILGEENGIQCTRKIKEIQPNTRVILISAYPDQAFHREGLRAGAVAFLDKKDLDAAALKQVMDDLGAN